MLKLNSKETDIWFTSDTHYWHKNMTYGESVWPNKEETTRRFNTTKEMSQHLVKQINSYVKEDDILFHLGDWSFSGIDNIWNFRKQLRCKNIHLIFGNHDHHIINNKIVPNCSKGFGTIFNSMNYEQGRPVVEGTEVHAQELFSSANHYLEIQIDNVLVVLMHYPIQEWNDRFKKSYHLFGHVHGRIPHGNGRLDVGIDNAYKLLKEYRPFHWDDIKRILGNPLNERG